MYISGIIIIFFTVIGIASFIGALIKAHMICDTSGLIMLISQVNEQNAEAKIRSAVMITEAAKDCRIICVCAEDDPAREICEKMQRQYPRLEIVDEYGST